MSSTFDHHVDDTPSTNDPLVKGRKGKFLYPCFICKDMHRTFLCPSMDEASHWLENITDHQQVIPTSDSKLSLDPPLVDQVVDLDLSVVDPTLPFESEVKVDESVSFPPDLTLSSKSVKTEVVSLTKYSSCSSLPVENEPKPVDVFMLCYDYSRQEEILSVSKEPSLSSEVISFDWSNLTESHIHSSVPFSIVVNVTARCILHTIVDEGSSVSILSSTAWKDLGSP